MVKAFCWFQDEQLEKYSELSQTQGRNLLRLQSGKDNVVFQQKVGILCNVSAKGEAYIIRWKLCKRLSSKNGLKNTRKNCFCLCLLGIWHSIQEVRKELSWITDNINATIFYTHSMNIPPQPCHSTKTKMNILWSHFASINVHEN